MKFGGVVDSTCKTLAYEWKFPDGTTDTSAHPSKSFNDVGPHIVTLEAWCDGCSAPRKSATVTVVVNSAAEVEIVSAKIESDNLKIDVLLQPTGSKGFLTLELVGPTDTKILLNSVQREGQDAVRREYFSINLLTEAAEYTSIRAIWRTEKGDIVEDEFNYHITVLGRIRVSQYRIVTEEACGLGTDQDICTQDINCNWTQQKVSKNFAGGSWRNGTGRLRNQGNYILYGTWCEETGHPLPSACVGTFDSKEARYSFESRAELPGDYNHRAQGSVARHDDNEVVFYGDTVYIQTLGERTVSDRCPGCKANNYLQLDHFLGEDGGCLRANNIASGTNDPVLIKIH